MSKMRILLLEDDPTDAFLVQRTLDRGGFQTDIIHATTPAEYLTEIEHGHPDLILVDNGLPGFSGDKALEIARERCPKVPLIIVSGAGDEDRVTAKLKAGAADYVLKDQLWQLPNAIRRASSAGSHDDAIAYLERHNRAMIRLVTAVQELSLARNLETVMTVVRRAARELTGADGATFVLRDGDNCHYADEDAISPLWKGQRFPMSACISGWAMLNRQPVAIEDIYADSRIPVDAYRPTFVKSLVMVPIRTEAPIGAIGNYWAHPHLATPEEVELLQALANTTAVAMENVQLYEGLEQRVQDRTRQLEAANRELETFSYSVSHDLQAPVRRIQGFTQLLAEKCQGKLDDDAAHYFDRVCSGTREMSEIIADLLRLARFARAEIRRGSVDLSQIANEVASRLQTTTPDRHADFNIHDGLEVCGDAGLLRVALENLLSNAWKYSAKRERAVIEFGSMAQPDGGTAFFVRDNGAGFDMQHAGKLFGPFQRLHTQEEFSGTGIGLATVQRIIHRHGGRIWAEAAVDKGATFFFTLPQQTPSKLPD